MGIHHHTLRVYIELGLVQPFWIGERAWITAKEITRFKRDEEYIKSQRRKLAG